MLRVGLTGDLGSGKSTVARMLAARGAIVLSSDDMGRALMQPGQPVYAAIVERFGPESVAPDGSLDRRRLAQLAFDPAHPRIDELNAIVHPAVLAEQARQVAAHAHTHNIVVIESALIFSAYGQTAEHLRQRFDCIVLVTAPESLKVERFLARTLAGREATADERAALTLDAHRRLALQQTEQHADECLVIHNNADIAALEPQLDHLWSALLQRESQQ
jgi:dephospho-CoA kinase